MSSISAVVTLRPIRFAFLVRPDDAKRVHEIFKVNTCLWGGKFNPIIPFFRHVPKWWDRHGNSFESALQIINGYLDSFEPDFLVEAEPGLADGLGFNKDRVMQLASLLSQERERYGGQGLDVFDLYRDLYKKEFQFVRRNEHDIVDVVPQEEAFKAFCTSLFGGFPEEEGFKYFAAGFTDAFAPKKINLTPETLVELYRSRFTSALRIGHSTIEVNYHDHSDPAIFVLDAKNPRDLIDYWNLRGFKHDVLPVPVQWLDRMSPFCKELIELNHRPLPGNPNGVMIRATVMFSRSIPTADIEGLYATHLRVDQEGANVRQDWYPPIWRPTPGFSVRRTRPTLSAGERRFDMQIDGDKPEIRFDTLHPEFAAQYDGGENRWANVVKLEDWSGKAHVATVFPSNYRDPKVPNFGSPRGEILPTTEGFVYFSQFKNIPNVWRLDDGTTAIREWLKTYDIDAELSDAGRSTQQIIQTLGGFWGVSSFAHAEIVKLLNKVSRRPVSPSIQHQEFKNKIERAVKGDTGRHDNFETLVERGAVELGLELKCSKCGSWGWHPLRELNHEVACSLCLRQFRFPIVEPSSNQNSRWAYRLVGPFALPDFAKGGYAASLTIRFFSRIFGGHETGLTWSAGQILHLAPSDRVEADVILWHQRKAFMGPNYQSELVFGEAKSFRGENAEERRSIADAFQQEDVDRMKRLASRFPGAILVFSTMKQASDLSANEIDRIKKLAEWGRTYIRERRQTRAPVIVLTGTELFASFSLSEAWRATGGRHAAIAESLLGRSDKLRVLADMTQQLYLGMQSYGEWHRAKWERRRLLRERRVAAAGDNPV
ncbi:hypothetical protein [Paraburkholderia nemoris]|uniref:Uncharacterized protein n=1 Tax=Paraburkholderia nemoris TaxID=2793076 RepID=A0ABM8S0A5_9BURK|nr:MULTISPECIES: hypothetical protein [Paraburkholderia]MBK3812403.1 hypothetical protein [Paraburkholderia aspalathi]CAE6765229.1 hypothetical protein R75777_03648 [Paraburkholderia nemoris]CAE6781701.1 hypothetical protein R69776_04343 [Paraburkholderia nemoris]